MGYVEGLKDVILQPLYDTVPYAAAGQTQLTFFQVQLGAGTTAFGTGAKSLADTNMTLAGQLPAPQTFTIYGFRLQTPWNIPFLDLNIMLNGCVFELLIGTKPFLQVPARNIPAGNGPFFSGSVAAAATNNGAVSGWPVMSNRFAIGEKPVKLNSTENFQVTLKWPGGVQAISALSSITLYLDGILKRSAQ